MIGKEGKSDVLFDRLKLDDVIVLKRILGK